MITKSFRLEWYMRYDNKLTYLSQQKLQFLINQPANPVNIHLEAREKAAVSAAPPLNELPHHPELSFYRHVPAPNVRCFQWAPWRAPPHQHRVPYVPKAIVPVKLISTTQLIVTIWLAPTWLYLTSIERNKHKMQAVTNIKHHRYIITNSINARPPQYSSVHLWVARAKATQSSTTKDTVS